MEGFNYKKAAEYLQKKIHADVDCDEFWVNTYNYFQGDYEMQIHVMVQYGKAEYSSLELYKNGDRIESLETDRYYDIEACYY